jgi:hypothetical protein
MRPRALELKIKSDLASYTTHLQLQCSRVTVTEERKNGRTEERKNGRTEERKNGRTEERKNGRTEERKNGRTKRATANRRKGLGSRRLLDHAGVSQTGMIQHEYSGHQDSRFLLDTNSTAGRPFCRRDCPRGEVRLVVAAAWLSWIKQRDQGGGKRRAGKIDGLGL